MINRELTARETEIFDMIRPTTFQDMVDAVRKDMEYSKYNAKKELRNLRNCAEEIREIKDIDIKGMGDTKINRLINDNKICEELI